MGAILDTPHTEKTTENGIGNDLRYGVCSMQGWRVEMEDAHCAKVGLPDLTDWSYFAGEWDIKHFRTTRLICFFFLSVFDGHAGACTSAHCAENLLNTILQTDSFLKLAVGSTKLTNKSDETDSSGDQPCVESTGEGEHLLANIKASIRDGFLKLDEKMKSLPSVESGEDVSGSTAVCALISPTHFFFANCGDSRAVLSRNGRAFFSTQDHKPINPSEKQRIQAAGGSVMIQRVNGSLAVSRALGDYQYKQVCTNKHSNQSINSINSSKWFFQVVGRGPCEQLVSPEPEITIQERHETDEFLVLACDGIWDVMSNDELCDFIRHQLRIHSNLETVCSSIIDTCLHKVSCRLPLSLLLINRLN